MTFQCIQCKGTHSKQVFVSHSRADTQLLDKIKVCLCQAQVAPFFYKIPEDFPASWEIMKELRQSMALMAVLGPEVSRRYWTQVWIGFEIGAFAAFQEEKELQTPLSHNIPHTILIEDVSQASDAPIPFVDLALLLDFSDPDSWASVQIVAELINDEMPFNKTVAARANNLRLFRLIDKPALVCPDTHCKGKYELLIWTGKTERDELSYPILPRSFSVKCVICRNPMLITGSEDHPGNPQDWTVSAAPVVGHISEYLERE